MKTISKILGLVLALSLVLSFAAFASAADEPLATFTFPTSSSTDSWQDGNGMDSGTSFTSGNYTLTFTDCTKVYSKGNDSAGTGFIKFGTSSLVGTLTFTVPEGVTKVELHLAKYKNNTSYYSINGGAAVQISNATPGYDVVTVDTSSTKTITLSSTNDGKRMVLLSVLFYGEGSGPVHTCEWNETADSCVAKTHLKHTLTYSCKDSTCDKTTTSDENHDYNSTGYCATCGYQFTTKGTLTITEANTKAAAAGDSYTSDFWLVSGKVKSVANATYGNLYIEDENGNELYVYGLYMPYGGVRYDEMETKPQVGDTITIATVLGTYTDSKTNVTTNQAKNAWLMDLTPAECEHPSVSDYVCGDCGAPVPPEADTELSIEEIEVLAAAMNGGVTPDKYYVVGVITEITNETYGNMVIEDEAGNTLVIYGSYDATGENRYDAMTAPHAVGDTVKIYGAVTQYNNVAEVVNGWVEIVERGENPNTGDSTSLIPAVIVAALAVTGTALVIKKKEF